MSEDAHARFNENHVEFDRKFKEDTLGPERLSDLQYLHISWDAGTISEREFFGMLYEKHEGEEMIARRLHNANVLRLLGQMGTAVPEALLMPLLISMRQFEELNQDATEVIVIPVGKENHDHITVGVCQGLVEVDEECEPVTQPDGCGFVSLTEEEHTKHMHAAHKHHEPPVVGDHFHAAPVDFKHMDPALVQEVNSEDDEG